MNKIRKAKKRNEMNIKKKKTDILYVSEEST